jgi:hypothetical protein
MSIAGIMLAMTAVSLVGSVMEQDAAAEQFNAESKELTRQQEVANEIAQEDRSERVNEADRQQAAALAGMEVVGGSGSANENRMLGEIGGNSGIDLARIEGNRRREVSSLEASKSAAKERAKGAISSSQLGFIGSALGNAGTAAQANQVERGQAIDLAAINAGTK